MSDMSEEEVKQLIRDAVKHKRKTLKGSGVFYSGEIVELKGFSFMISNVTAHKLSLTLIK